MLKKRLTALVSAATMIMGTTGTFAMNANADSEEIFIASYTNEEVDLFLEGKEKEFPINKEIAEFVLETERASWTQYKEEQIKQYGENCFVNSEEYNLSYPTGVIKNKGGTYQLYSILEDYNGLDKALFLGKTINAYEECAYTQEQLMLYPQDAVLTPEEMVNYLSMTKEEALIYSINFFKEHNNYLVIDDMCCTAYYDLITEAVSEVYVKYGTKYKNGYVLQADFKIEDLIDYDALNKSFIENYDSITKGTFEISKEVRFLLNEEYIVLGDANCDGSVTIADAVAIQQYLSNAEKYPLSEQGIINADFDGNGLTALDALEIQKMDAAKTIS